MKIVIIGSVAAGTSVAAKARRNNIDCEIKIYEKDKDISYSVCGLPYYIGEDYISRKNISPRNPKWFKDRFDIDIFTSHEVLEVDYTNKKLKILNLEENIELEDDFDKLVFATGGENISPSIEGMDLIEKFHLKNVESADRIKRFIEENEVKKALIIGSGFVGLELIDNFYKLGIESTIIEMQEHLMPYLDKDMSIYLEDYLVKKGINFILNDKIEKFISKKEALSQNGKKLDFDIVIFATGISPNSKLAESIGVKLGTKKAIKVNEKMQTNLDGVFAVGDCCEHKCLIDNSYMYRPLGSTANKMGRIAGDSITGGGLEFRGVLGTGIFKVFDYTVAYTGFSEKEARKKGYDVEIIHNIKEDKSKYLKESKQIVIKAIADRKSQKLLGVQILGEGEADKRIDVFVSAITSGMSVGDLFHLDLAYAPPFSTTKDPVMYTGMVLDNAMNRGRKILLPMELIKNREVYKVVDVRSSKDYDKGHIEGAVNIPLAKLKDEVADFSKNDNIVVHCNKGVTGNAAQNLLINLGFENVYNLSGGYKNYAITKKYL